MNEFLLPPNEGSGTMIGDHETCCCTLMLPSVFCTYTCEQRADLPDFRKIVEGGLGHMDGVVQSDHMGLTVDPQHRGGDVLS